MLLLAGVIYLRRDGQRASRLHLLWRAIVAWSPVCLAFLLSVVAIIEHLDWGPWLALALPGLLAVVCRLHCQVAACKTAWPAPGRCRVDLAASNGRQVLDQSVRCFAGVRTTLGSCVDPLPAIQAGGLSQ